MVLRVVRLGSPRDPHEGLRIGTVRRPPRGVAKTDYAKRDYYDVWLPNLAPSDELLKHAHAASSDRDWRTFERRYRAEMKAPEARHLLDLLAALSRHSNIAVGCYCVDASRCHRSILRALLSERGAALAGEQ